jgi:hypothetical protein
VAFYRPRKRTYFCLQWMRDASVWTCAHLQNLNEGANATVHRSTRHHTTPAVLQARTGHDGNRGTTRLEIQATGLFLRIPLRDGTTITAALVERVFALPNKFVTKEFQAVPGVPYEQDQGLWDLRAPVAAPVPAPAPAPQHTLTPIPRRIAWLIAEDAQRQGDTCPITLDTITPLTASVTTCFHCFDAEQLQAWIVSHPESGCPLCKKSFLATRAFEDEAPA